ncbi:MAG: hypothetical protein IJL02_11445 [Methanobrevibacter sp.]|uniref:hypothetical protein n=1 Tax=Methanobrevibacter sp. TaxID=66852 RepID=UPI0025F06D42|nr:hypothetical protein [Methanobrevibacter sp.]MBQ6100460.1 hypothetical protein [Methanobrevibacter sp.]
MGFFDKFKKNNSTTNTSNKTDYAVEFKKAFEALDIDKCLEIGKKWEENDKDANYFYGSTMLFSANTLFTPQMLADLYRDGLNTPNVTNKELASWYKDNALALLEKRANEMGLTVDQVLNSTPSQPNPAPANDDSLPDEIDFTVFNQRTNENFTFHLKKNQYSEYIADLDSTKNIFDYCFGGDIITVTYSVYDDGSYKDLPVDYNIMDADYVENVMRNDPRFKAQYDLTVKIEGSSFYKSVTSNTLERIDFSGVEADFNEIKKHMLTHLFDMDNSLLVDISVGDEIKADIANVDNPFTSFQQKYGTYDLKIKKIEFVSRLSKPDGRKNIPMTSAINVFKEY